jgi:hypothetical protein
MLDEKRPNPRRAQALERAREPERGARRRPEASLNACAGIVQREHERVIATTAGGDMTAAQGVTKAWSSISRRPVARGAKRLGAHAPGHFSVDVEAGADEDEDGRCRVRRWNLHVERGRVQVSRQPWFAKTHPAKELSRLVGTWHHEAMIPGSKSRS